MDPEFWLQRWKQQQIGFHRPDVNPLLRRFWPELELPADSGVFVPLCGKSKDLWWLHEQGHWVLGVELSELAVCQFFEEQGVESQRQSVDAFQLIRWAGISLYQGDFFDLTAAHLTGVQGFYDRAALVALPPDMRLRYVRHLAKILSTGSKGLLISMDYPPHEMQGPPFAVSGDEVVKLFQGSFEVELLESSDCLAANPKLRDRGLSHMQEQVWRLQR